MPPHTLTDIQRAARFNYLQQNCFGGRGQGRTFGTATTSPPGLNLLRLEETVSTAHLRLSWAYIEKLDWYACIDRYDRPDTFFYLAPPYWETEGYGLPFGFDRYERMAGRLGELQGRAILTLNNHPAMRALFARFDMECVDIQYTVGGAGNTALRSELIIYSWDRSKDPVGLF